MKSITKITTIFVLGLFLTSCGTSSKSTNNASGSDSPATESAQSPKNTYKQSPTAKGKRTCTRKNDVRYIEVVNTESGCAVNYTKHGSTSEIASASKDMGHCDRVSEKTQVNLVESGFTCE